MQIVSTIFLIIFFAAFAGIIRPYIGALNRWQFAVAAFISAMICGATAPKPPESSDVATAGQDLGRKQQAKVPLEKRIASAKSQTAPKQSSGSGPKKQLNSDRTSEKQSRPAKDHLAEKGNQQLWIVKSQNGIKARLNDPDSAKFRNIRFYSGGPAPAVCGEVNARNGFGGYSGYQRFIASGEKTAFLASDSEPNEFQIAWRQLCISHDRDAAYVP